MPEGSFCYSIVKQKERWDIGFAKAKKSMVTRHLLPELFYSLEIYELIYLKQFLSNMDGPRDYYTG